MVALSTEMLSIVASLFSVALAIVAIWLSFKFFQISGDASARISESSNRIAASVDRLEALFSSLYADTFTLMKDTVGDMRRHIWSNPATQPERESDDGHDPVALVRRRSSEELERLLRRQESTEARITELASELGRLSTDSAAEVQPVTPEGDLNPMELGVLKRIREMKDGGEEVTLDALVKRYGSEIPEKDLVHNLFRLHWHGILHWNGAPAIILRPSQIEFADGRPRSKKGQRERVGDGSPRGSAS